MRKRLFILVLFTVVCSAEPPHGVNICNTDQGTVYQQMPCATDLPLVGNSPTPLSESSGLRSKIKRAEESDAQILTDLSIDQIKKEQYVDADVSCRIMIESMVRYDHRWTDGILAGPRLSSARWKTDRGGLVMWRGNKIEMMNGLGLWIPHNYSCLYNPATKRAVSVKVAPGK